jgi:aminoglycoside phosphotransferase (APT) family kinase protein
MNNKNFIIDEALVHCLISLQFPQWKDLPIRPVALSGWDNRTFHLGEQMLIRLPSAADYALQVEKEHKWLPKLAPFLPLPIPVPLAIGEPANGYPWKWSVYRWLEGKTAASEPLADLCKFAISLAQFLIALQQIDSIGGPLAGPHSFYRGGSLAIYSADTYRAISALKGKIDVDTATEVWETALKTSWEHLPVWVHGDISVGNLLVRKGQLSAVIDFGQLAIGDPSCDLAITWTLFKDKSRNVFRKMLPLDPGTWARGRAWTLWKALVVAAGLTNPNNAESAQCWRIIEEVLAEYKAKEDQKKRITHN